MKKVAIIPALLGSVRIPDKNLILVDGYPMMFKVVDACKKSGAFDAIYINSEHDVFKNWAKMLGVRFYKRNPARGGSECTMKNKSRTCTGDRCQTHDHFLFDFMEFLKEPTYLSLIHTTSPLLKPETIKEFMKELEEKKYDSLFSIEERYTETFYGKDPLNFSMAKKIPTQTLPPLQMITWAMTGWNTRAFMDSYKADDANKPGPTYCGNVGRYKLDKIEAIDVDNWDDLMMAEACLQYRRHQVKPGSIRVPEGFLGVESCLVDLIKRDGVAKFVDKGQNSKQSNFDAIIKEMGKPPWIYVLIYSATDQSALICQKPGEGCRKHFHASHEEWWIILQGQFEWRLGDGTIMKTKKGDVVSLPKGMPHQIVCIGDQPGIRLANGGRDMDHVYVQ